MTATTFSVTFEEVELDVSSFSYRSDSTGASGGCVVKGVDYLEFITDNLEAGTLSLMMNDTEILTCTLDTNVRPTLGATSDSIQLTFGDDIVFSQSVATTFDIDDLSATTSMSGGYWSFRLPEIDAGYQSGMTVNYDDVERYILSVSVSMSDSSVTVTLTEGAQPPDDDSIDGDEGLPACTYTITVGSPSSAAFSVFCSSGYDDAGTYISPEGYTYDMFVFLCRQFTLPADSDVGIEFTTLRSGLDDSGIASGFEFDLIQGEYTPFTNPSPTVYTYRGTGEFRGELPAGIYTCRLTLYINRAVDPVAWVTSSYTLYVRTY